MKEWNLVVEKRVAEAEQLSFGVVTAILTDFEVVDGDLAAFLRRHVGVATDSAAFAEDRRKSFKTLQSLFRRLDREKEQRQQKGVRVQLREREPGLTEEENRETQVETHSTGANPGNGSGAPTSLYESRCTVGSSAAHIGSTITTANSTTTTSANAASSAAGNAAAGSAVRKSGHDVGSVWRCRSSSATISTVSSATHILSVSSNPQQHHKLQSCCRFYLSFAGWSTRLFDGCIIVVVVRKHVF